MTRLEQFYRKGRKKGINWDVTSENGCDNTWKSSTNEHLASFVGPANKRSREHFYMVALRPTIRVHPVRLITFVRDVGTKGTKRSRVVPRASQIFLRESEARDTPSNRAILTKICDGRLSLLDLTETDRNALVKMAKHLLDFVPESQLRHDLDNCEKLHNPVDPFGIVNYKGKLRKCY